ncbi:MAG: ATP-binding protein [Actinomycetota bacterium]
MADVDGPTPLDIGQPVAGWRDLLDPARRVASQSVKDELRTVFLFEFLTDKQLDVLGSNGTITTVPAGTVCREGEPAQSFYVLLDGGDVVLTKRAGGQDIELHRTSARGTYFGAIPGCGSTYDVTVRLTQPSRLFGVAADLFARFMQTVWPVAVHLLESTAIGGLRQRQLLGLQEKQRALATLTAGLTHQLNNPAAATVRAVADLRDSFAESHRNLGVLAAADPHALPALLALQTDIAGSAAALSLSPIEAADHEDAIDDWFGSHGIDDSWRYAPTLVEAGLDVSWLDRVAATVASEHLECAISWLKQFIDSDMRIREIAEAAARIAAVVNGAKPYSQMDRGPYQCIDVHEMLRSTVLMFGDRVAVVGKPVALVKDLDHGLPELHCYPADLNQVWTNLIDNALYAMNGHGTLTVRTRRDGASMIRVEICDDGPGIPHDIIDRIFTPFFTTKPVGEGPGLGLDLVWRIVVDRHHGHISVRSRPGDTRFIICLPLEAPGPAG